MNDVAPDARDLLLLAIEYHRAAKAQASISRPGVPRSRAPYRLLAIHAIELYLSALLRSEGASAEEVRAFNHDLGARADRAVADIGLRRKTMLHLQALTAGAEYRACRYAADGGASGSQLNRLAPTLDEVAEKSAQAFARAAHPNSASRSANRAA